MDSFEINKIIGAVLGALFVVFSIAIVSDALFASPAPATPGYAIEAAEGGDNTEVAGAAEGVEPIAVLLANANPDAGAELFRRCAACHTIEQGGANKVGPNLWGVVNRPIASVEGFAYSGAIQEFSQGGAVVWDYEHLAGFLRAPKSYIKGTSMGFAGVKKGEDLGNLIAYLRTQSDSPAPLPEAAAPAAAATDASAGAPPEAAPGPVAPITEAPGTAEPSQPD
ncbi:MAG TPA: cytochrome c family protein [Mesorhizobium sp.]|jgi:cytochrome c|nr:cytochrome c family protein [Mesorhizobium sp.]